MKLPRTLHPDLNGLPAAECLWCSDVAPHVSIHCCHPVAAVGDRASRAGSEEAQAGLAWLRLPARLPSAAEQQPAGLCPKRRVAAIGTPEPAPLVHRPNPSILLL